MWQAASTAKPPLTAADVLSTALNEEGADPPLYPAPQQEGADPPFYPAPQQKEKFGFSTHGELQNPVIPIYTEMKGSCSNTSGHVLSRDQLLGLVFIVMSAAFMIIPPV